MRLRQELINATTLQCKEKMNEIEAGAVPTTTRNRIRNLEVVEILILMRGME